MYADFDPHKPTVTFSDHNENAGWAFRLIFSVIGLTIEAEQIFDWLEQTTPKIGDELQEKQFKNLVAKHDRDERIFAQFVKDEQRALQGNAEGQFNIGKVYVTGSGLVPKNLVRAHLWFSLSAAHGNEKAKRSRERLERNMTPAQIEEAQAAASSWRPLTLEQIAEIDKYWAEFKWKPKSSN